MTIRYAILVVFLIALQIYTYSSFRLLFYDQIVRLGYIILSIVYLITICYFFWLGHDSRRIVEDYPWVSVIFTLAFGMFIMHSVWATIVFIDDIRSLLVFGSKKLTYLVQDKPTSELRLSRSQFLQWLAFGIGTWLYSMLLLGIGNRYNFKKYRVKINLSGLSKAWKGYKIIQISDIHCGSFSTNDYEKVQRGIDMINEEKADVILFTGDLVNNLTEELTQWKNLFSQMSARVGVFSTLGNHDYGDYYRWESQEAKTNNLKKMKEEQAKMGWKMLNNTAIKLTKEGASDHITLVGVENWSAKSTFPKYGKLAEAMQGLPEEDVKILMSHDPSHWEAEVLDKYPSIKLMLAGHTHGMQFGLETPFFKWSPVQWIYKQWAGLYKKGSQMLYVNRGFGFLGYPGRVGILPEITVLELV